MARPVHLLHITPSFGLGGAQVRTVQLMNYFGIEFRHTVVSLDGDLRAGNTICHSVAVNFRACPKTNNPLRAVPRLRALLAEEKPDLVLTYNWGSMDGVLAAVSSGIPVIHTEDGFGNEEAIRQKQRRVWFRRLLLRHVRAVVAPSRTLARIMRDVWKLPAGKLRYIPNGVDPDRFLPRGNTGAEHNQIVVGVVGQLRREKRHDLLIDTCVAINGARAIRLVLVGDGPERLKLERRVTELNAAGKVEFLGHVPDPKDLYRRFDIFALSSSTEQMPLSVLEAMASGLPVLSTDVGDVKDMVSESNHPFIVPWRDYQLALTRLVDDANSRRRLGFENRARCIEVYSIHRMFQEYEALYRQAGRN